MASSGMIAGEDLKVEIGFLTYGCTLIGLSINLLLYADFPLFSVFLLIGFISFDFSSRGRIGFISSDFSSDFSSSSSEEIKPILPLEEKSEEIKPIGFISSEEEEEKSEEIKPILPLEGLFLLRKRKKNQKKNQKK